MRVYQLTPAITNVARIMADEVVRKGIPPDDIRLWQEVNLWGWRIGDTRIVLDTCELGWAIDLLLIEVGGIEEEKSDS